MGTIRCGTCHTLILNESDRNWHVVFLNHEEPYDDEDGEDEVSYLESNRGEEE